LEVATLDPSDLNAQWQGEVESPGTQLAAALGMALTVFPTDAAVDQGPNLIEGTLAQLRLPLRPVLIRSLSPVAAVLLAAATVFVMHFWNVKQMATVRAELDELQPVQARANELRLRLFATDEKVSQLQHLQRKLPQPNWQLLLTRLSQSMPDDVWLDRLSIRDGELATLGGASYTDRGVYDFVNFLKGVPDIAEIALEGTGESQNETGPTTTFDLKATLADFSADSVGGTTK
jgi:hypothetical protein